MREPDETIPPEEDLYRGLEAGFVDGQRVNEKAIDLEGTSVHRSSHAAPAVVLTETRTEVGAIYVHAIPPAQELSNGVEWEWLAVDCPSEAEGISHAELRARRTCDRPSREANKPGGKAAKLELRLMLASKMRVLSRPPAEPVEALPAPPSRPPSALELAQVTPAEQASSGTAQAPRKPRKP